MDEEDFCPSPTKKDKQESVTNRRIEYDRSQILGKGGFAIVFSGKFDGKIVAVKRIQRDMLVEDNQREEEALRRLNHPNVINLLFVEDDEDFKCFALELCQASLNQLFLPDSNPDRFTGPFPSDKDALIQLTEGLHYIHSNGFVHRDVKPGNVLISLKFNDSEKSVLKWSDFGLSKPVNERGTFSNSGVKGTRDWLSPEILKMMQADPNNSNRGTIKSDTYALGEVFFYIISGGNHPFGQLDDFSIPKNVLADYKINMEALGNKWFAKNTIEGMITNDISKRFSLEEVIDSLQSSSYTANDMDNELEGLCETAFNDSMNNIQVDRMSRLLDQGARIHERHLNICHYLCSMESLQEQSREKAVKRLISKGIKIQCDSLNAFLNLKSISELHLISIATMLVKYGRIDVETTNPLYNLYVIGTINVGRLSKITQLFIDLGLDFNAIDKNGENVLLHLCQNYSGSDLVERIKLLVSDFCISVNSENKDTGRSVLHFLLSNPNIKESLMVDALIFLLNNGLDLKFENEKPEVLCQRNTDQLVLKNKQFGRNVLFYLYGMFGKISKDTLIKITKLLIHLGLDINETKAEKDGCNVLHYLCRYYSGHDLVERIQILIVAFGLSINSLSGISGRNALHFLLIKESKELIPLPEQEVLFNAVKCLVHHGIDIKCKDHLGRNPLFYLYQQQPVGYYSPTITNGFLAKITDLIVERGVDICEIDKDGMNLLHVVCDKYGGTDLVDVLKYLTNRGLPINGLDKNGFNALHLLFRSLPSTERNGLLFESVTFLTESGVDVNHRDVRGRSPVFYFYECWPQNFNKGDLEEITEILLEQNACITSTDNDGMNLLHIACRHYNGSDLIEVIKFLINNDISINVLDKNGKNAFHYLCERSWDYVTQNSKTLFNCIKFLMKSGIAVFNSNSNICIEKEAVYLVSFFQQHLSDIDGMELDSFDAHIQNFNKPSEN